MALATEIEQFLEVGHKDLRARSPHILNLRVDTKKVGGRDTGQVCVTFVVDEKLPVALLDPQEFIPKELANGPVNYKTDVVELRSTKRCSFGKTPVSELPPAAQKRLLGAILPKRLAGARTVIRASAETDWPATGKLLGTEDQAQCGDCVGYGCGDATQDDFSLLGVIDKLSKTHPFFCSGGTCSGGSAVEPVLNFIRDTGIALDKDCPDVSGATGADEPCGANLAADWYLRGKKIESWSSTTDTNVMRTWLAVAPLVTTMEVPYSFFNYTGGIYRRQSNDPIAGGHCIETVGVSDSEEWWKIKNSWGKGWGEPGAPGIDGGYARIALGDSGIDAIMYSVVPSTSPPGPTPPGPTPSPCPYGNAVAKILSFVPWLLRRKGRFYYRNP